MVEKPESKLCDYFHFYLFIHVKHGASPARTYNFGGPVPFPQRLHLDVQMGEHTIDPGAARAKDTVKNMEYVLRHLIDQVLYIGKQQDFQRVQ